MVTLRRDQDSVFQPLRPGRGPSTGGEAPRVHIQVTDVGQLLFRAPPPHCAPEASGSVPQGLILWQDSRSRPSQHPSHSLSLNSETISWSLEISFPATCSPSAVLLWLFPLFSGARPREGGKQARRFRVKRKSRSALPSSAGESGRRQLPGESGPPQTRTVRCHGLPCATRCHCQTKCTI